MSWQQTAITARLGLKFPIIQGPFGGGLSSVALTAAVSNSGGLGSFGVHHLASDKILATAKAIRANTNQPFALNLWMPFEESEKTYSEAEFDACLNQFAPYFHELNTPLPTMPIAFTPIFDEQIEAIFQARPAVFSFVYGVPSAEIISRCRSLNITTMGASTNVDEALALESAGVDVIVATGFEAGGHRVSFLSRAEESLMGGMSLIPQVVDAVKVPVVAAGGIADGRGIAAAMLLGADAVQIGTAFLACDESGANDLHRTKLFSAEAKKTDLTRVFSGRLARGMRNRLMLEASNKSIATYPMQNWIAGQLKQAAIKVGRADLMSLWCGQSAPLLQHKKAESLLQSLVAQTDLLLKS